jgi:ssDNA thymidine ADP-ribosyltransferase, DarT
MELDAFLTTVRASKQFNHFYHFTDKKNLESIRARGLLCTSELRKLDILKDVVTGGDAASLASDAQNGVDQYVCLCFTKNHPMCHVASGRGVDPVYLSINPDVIKEKGVMITDAPSNQAGVVPQPASVALDNLHLDTIYQWIDWKLHPEAYDRRIIAEKYEILVPKQIAVAYMVEGL